MVLPLKMKPALSSRSSDESFKGSSQFFPALTETVKLPCVPWQKTWSYEATGKAESPWVCGIVADVIWRKPASSMATDDFMTVFLIIGRNASSEVVAGRLFFAKGSTSYPHIQQIGDILFLETIQWKSGMVDGFRQFVCNVTRNKFMVFDGRKGAGPYSSHLQARKHLPKFYSSDPKGKVNALDFAREVSKKQTNIDSLYGLTQYVLPLSDICQNSRVDIICQISNIAHKVNDYDGASVLSLQDCEDYRATVIIQGSLYEKLRFLNLENNQAWIRFRRIELIRTGDSYREFKFGESSSAILAWEPGRLRFGHVERFLPSKCETRNVLPESDGKEVAISEKPIPKLGNEGISSTISALSTAAGDSPQLKEVSLSVAVSALATARVSHPTSAQKYNQSLRFAVNATILAIVKTSHGVIMRLEDNTASVQVFGGFHYTAYPVGTSLKVHLHIGDDHQIVAD